MASLHRTHYLTTFKQRFENDKPEKEILLEDKYWTKSIPHEQSGPCETYDPPFDSDPGYDISMFFTLKDLLHWIMLEVAVYSLLQSSYFFPLKKK